MTRSCRTCRWFQPDPDGNMGICANPELGQELGLPIPVRSRELHCRKGWGNDRWEAAAQDIVLEIRVKSPASDRADQGIEDSAPSMTVSRSIEAIVRAWDEPETAEANPDSPRP